ncbi:proline--tRNA ligase [Candidatus Micrarchaeota archaeon]|nr:proline--tRNA ligase [Candidatus Micrarchaeota archaeon]
MKVSKEKNFSEWFTEIVKEAGLADLRYNVKGFVVYMPWSVITMEKMYDIYEKELLRTGHKPAWFPLLIPESNFKLEAEHVEGFTPEVFWVTEHGAGEKFEEKLALRPTSETAMYRMYSLWIQGRKDLPFKMYQRASVYRYETKATRPFLRSREFFWLESHDCFATEEEAINQVKRDMEMTENVVHKRFCIPFIFFKRPKWDKFAGAVDTFAADTMMPDGKVIQLPSTHLLGQNFSRPFNIQFTDTDGEKKYVWQTCYGPAITRIYGAMISILGDDKGLRLPFELAPIQIVIIPIFTDENKEKIVEYCRQVESMLTVGSKRYCEEWRIKVDLSENTPGYKFNEWEMKGVPIRLEVGQKEMDSQTVTVVIRTRKGRETVPLDNLIETIKEKGEQVTEDLRKWADEQFENVITDAKTMDELKTVLEKGGFARVPLCSIDEDGKECADWIKAETHGNIRGVRFDRDEKPDPEDKCIWCGKPARYIVYIARQY